MSEIEKLILNDRMNELDSLLESSAETFKKLSFEDIVTIIANGHYDIIEKHFFKFPKHITHDVDDYTLAHYASDTNDMSLFGILEHCDYDLDQKDSSGITPLMISVKNGNHVICQYLLDKGADVDSVSNDGSTLLHHSVIYSDKNKAVKILLNHGVDPKIKNQLGYSAIDYAKLLNRSYSAKLMEGFISVEGK